jgi:DNA-binding CsgD family transcriptional regulator
LTAAERETAILAAAGRTNKEIADVQHIAVRTVETRLQNVYSKLGITRRGDIHGRLGNL